MEKDKIKTYVRSDFLRHAMTTAPTVTVTPRDGKVNFSSAAVRLMGLRPGMRLVYMEIPDLPRSFGFRASDDADAFEVHKRYHDRKSDVLSIACKPLIRHLMERMGQENTFCAQIGTEYDDGFWAITASVKEYRSKGRKDSSSTAHD